jgi:hypothetical protein
MASRGEVAAAMGHVARAVMEEGHALLCERRQWVCNEKRLIESSGLAAVQDLFARTPDPTAFVQWVDLVANRIGGPAVDTSPWTDAGRRPEVN